MQNLETPITDRQAAFLGRLIAQHGKTAYQQAKVQAGVPPEITLLKLSKQQASRLIDLLSQGGQR